MFLIKKSFSVLLFPRYLYRYENTSRVLLSKIFRSQTISSLYSTLLPSDGLTLGDFVSGKISTKSVTYRKTPESFHPYLTPKDLNGNGQKVFLSVFGCQMNVSDSEIVWSILKDHGYIQTNSLKEADITFLITCSIRDGAERKIWNKLRNISDNKKARKLKKNLRVALLGCMAERLKTDLLNSSNELVDVVVGPDAYKDLPRLLAVNRVSGNSTINVLLSLDETYSDVLPVRLHSGKVTSFVSIQRGCDNMCSYCIVPFTRGKERGRPIQSIVEEIKYSMDNGTREVTLLGQNVNSYRDLTSDSLLLGSSYKSSSKFKTIYKTKEGGARFADLLHKVSEISPLLRVRFTSPHPKDFPQAVLELIAEKSNICKQIHLPCQAGSDSVLRSMRRGYTRDSYLELVQTIRKILPRVALSSDFIAGFCGESDADFEQTIDLIKTVGYHKMFVFPYSMREKTHANRALVDDVPDSVKTKRFQRLFELQRLQSAEFNASLIGTIQTVLIEGDSKRSNLDFQGRTDGNIKTIFSKSKDFEQGMYCQVKILSSNSETLKGHIVNSDTHHIP